MFDVRNYETIFFLLVLVAKNGNQTYFWRQCFVQGKCVLTFLSITFKFWDNDCNKIRFDELIYLLMIYRIIFAHFFVMNLVLWYKGSSAAIPFFTLVALLALWFGVSVPLTFVGAFFGFRKRAMEHPVRTNQIPRQIPDQSFYTQVNILDSIINQTKL